MSETETTASTGLSKSAALLLVVLTNAVSVGIGYLMSGEAPEPVAVTCELAADMLASPACAQPEDEAAIEEEEEAAENSTPE